MTETPAEPQALRNGEHATIQEAIEDSFQESGYKGSARLSRAAHAAATATLDALRAATQFHAPAKPQWVLDRLAKLGYGRAASRESGPMKDGWTLMHACGGEQRDLLWSGILAICPVCRWTQDLSPLHPNANRRQADD